LIGKNELHKLPRNRKSAAAVIRENIFGSSAKSVGGWRLL
jgi:hypothetical protein